MNPYPMKDERGFIVDSVSAIILRRDARGEITEARRSLARARTLFGTAAYYRRYGTLDLACFYAEMAAQSVQLAEMSRKRASNYRRAARGGAFL